ncbi:hypothetical protein ABZ208_14020 [Streptomyces sp. NPDC006208]|uniref:hypothetical protein n=1 Tax=Streptomyces sp. NPDC006208 TaxID=3156734 RepID=UPI0033BF0D8C
MSAREFLAAIDPARPFIPELHVDDCDDTTCARCRVLTPANLYEVDTWLDKASVFAKQYRECIKGELVITGLRIGHDSTRVVAKFGNTIVRHYDGRHTVRPTQHPTGELTAAEWNERYPVGTAVVAYPGCRPEDDPNGERLVTRTRSKASTYGGHTPVVWVDGHGAWIALTHVDAIPGGES